MSMYFLRVRWAYDDEEVEQFANKELRDARIRYLKTLPRQDGVTWKEETSLDPTPEGCQD